MGGRGALAVGMKGMLSGEAGDGGVPVDAAWGWARVHRCGAPCVCR